MFVILPINHKEMIDKTCYISTYNEMFLGNTGSKFDQNWLYGGLGFKINSKVNIELGYMNQFFTSKNRDQLNIITNVSF